MIRSLLKNTFAMSISNALATIVNIICMPILIRKLGIELYGEYIYLFIQSQLVFLIANFSFDTLLVKISAGKDSEQVRNKITVIIISRVMLYTISSFFLYFYLTLSQELNFLLVITSLISVFPMCFNLLWVCQVEEKMHVVAFCNLLGRLLFFILVLLPVENIYQIFFCWFLCNLLISLLYFKALDIKKLSFSLDIMKPISFIKKASSIFSFQLLVGLIPSVASNYIVNIGGVSYMVYYDIFNKASSVLNLFLSSFTQALFPIMAKIEKQKSIFFLIMKVVFFVTLLFVLMYFSLEVFREKIDIWVSIALGVNVKGVYNVLLSSLLFSFFVGLNSLFSRYLVIKNKISFINIATLMSLLIVLISPSLFYFKSGDDILYTLILSQLFMMLFMFGVIFFDFSKNIKSL